ncbi:MAG TPA: hypothetical protein VGH20_16030, partial [Myxococcales bacterium]
MKPKVHALLAAPALVFFAPALFFGRALYVRDSGLYFYPHKAWIAASLRAGQLPLWRAGEFGGLPILADPNYDVFHPFALFTDLLPLPWGFQVFAFASALLAAYGAFWVARELGLSDLACVVCAWAFAWSGPFVSLIESGPLLMAASIPPLFAAAIRLKRTGATRDVVLVAAAAALLFFTGVPEIAGSAFVLALVLSGRRAPRFVAGCALGAALAAVQLLPTAAFVRESTRSAGFAVEPAFRLSRIPALFVPLFDGWLDAPKVAYWTFDGTPWFEVVYVGSVVALLAALGARKRWPVVLAALGFAALSTTQGFALGRALLPPLRGIRFGDKFIMPLAMAVPIAAATGFDRLTAAARTSFDRLTEGAQARAVAMPLHRAVWSLAAACLALLTVASLFGGALPPLLHLDAAQTESFRVTAARMLPLELALLTLASLAILRRKPLWLLPIVALELGVPAAVLDRTVPRDWLRPSPIVGRLADASRDYRIDVQSTGLHEEDLPPVGELRSQQLFAVRHLALYDAAAPGLLFTRGYSGFPSEAMKELFVKGDLSALSVRYGVEFGSGRPVYPRLGFEPYFAEGPLRVYRNPRALKRVRMEPSGEAHLVSERNDELVIQTRADVPARLVIADTLADGWTATVDGAIVRPHKSALRIVDVPVGNHTIR